MVLELIPQTKLYTEIVHPIPVVLLHSFMKGIQGGLILGFVVGNGVALYKKFFKKKQNYSWKKVLYWMGKGMITGIVIVCGMTFYKMKRSDLQQNQSRAFRLKLNSKQNVIDNVTIGALVAGQLVLRNLYEVELGGGYVGALMGFVLINMMYIVKEKLKY